jgi:crotonobetainyl-CoA hydratase
MGKEHVKVERRGAVLEVTLERPKANAIDCETSRAMGEVWAAFRDDPELKCGLMLSGVERFFSAGWDLKAAAAGDPEDFGPGGFAGLTELFDLDKPVIAAVNGFAAGGGFELALACDLVVAVETARFSLPEVRRGFVADAGGVLRLPKRLPRALAMEMLLTGEPIDAAEAARRGLVNRVVAPGQSLAAATELAQRILAAAPLAVRAVKAIVDATEETTIADGYARLHDGSIEVLAQVQSSADAAEGPRAFAEGREPVWKGS